MEKILISFKDLLLITVGSLIYAFGLVFINIENELAEGGFTGLTLILNFLFQIDPAYSTLLLNIPMIFIGWKLLGNQSLIYTVYGTVTLSLSLWIWQRVAYTVELNHDLFIAGILAGLFAGIGNGLIYRSGGTTGGSDIIARIVEKKYGISMGKSLLVFDVFVLLLSLSYIDLPHMMYTLLASFVFSKVVTFMEEGSYAAKGLLIVTEESEAIAANIMSELDRGVTYLKAEGAYSKAEKKMLYCVLHPHEVVNAKNIIHQTDPYAFLSVLSVHEVLGEGFTYNPKQKNRLLSKKKKEEKQK